MVCIMKNCISLVRPIGDVQAVQFYRRRDKDCEFASKSNGSRVYSSNLPSNLKAFAIAGTSYRVSSSLVLWDRRGCYVNAALKLGI